MPLILSILWTITSKHKSTHEKPRILQDLHSYILLLSFSYIQILFRIFWILFWKVLQLLFYYFLFAPIHSPLVPNHLWAGLMGQWHRCWWEKYRKQNKDNDVYITSFGIFLFSNVLLSKSCILGLLLHTKTERIHQQTSIIKSSKYSSLWDISNRNSFLLIAHFVVTQENSESLKPAIYSIFTELYSTHSEDFN